MTIIGFGHKKRVGKDTAVRFAMNFARQYFSSLNCGILSFGDQLKGIAYNMFQWAGLQEGLYYENHPDQIDVILPTTGKSARMIWDEVGLLGRKIHPKVWVQMGISNSPDADVLFSKDVRFPTEIELIDSFHGYKYRIDRIVPQGGAVDQALNDYTGWSGIIDNNGGLREFKKQINTIVCQHLNPLVPTDKIVCPNCYACFKAKWIGTDAVLVGNPLHVGMKRTNYCCVSCDFDYEVLCPN